MKKVVIKLGGSLVSLSDDNLVNYEYLAKLKSLLEKFIKQDYQFAISIGGGYLCRKYQKMASQNIENISNRDLDWIGVATINLNAEMLRSFLGDMCEEKIIKYDDYKSDLPIEMEKPVIICAAEEPGHSSDVDAVKIANRVGASVLYRLTDVDAIYTSDPDKDPNAQALKNLTWQEYYKILGIEEFTPGGHYPIDPVAARMAEQSELSFYVMSGNDLENVENALTGEKFEGSIVTK